MEIYKKHEKTTKKQWETTKNPELPQKYQKNITNQTKSHRIHEISTKNKKANNIIHNYKNQQKSTKNPSPTESPMNANLRERQSPWMPPPRNANLQEYIHTYIHIHIHMHIHICLCVSIYIYNKPCVVSLMRFVDRPE